MDKPFLSLIREKARSPDFQDLIDLLLKRCDEYRELEAGIRKVFRENRAKREGITVEQIRLESASGSAKFALRPDEIKRYQDEDRKRVEEAKTDEKLFRWALVSEKHEREHERSWLDWKKLPPENKPLHRKLVDFLDENRRLLISFGEGKGWPIPEGY